MKIVTGHLKSVADNLEKQVDSITFKIEQLNKVIYLLSDININDTVFSIIKCRDKLIEEKDRLLKLAEVIYISLNYYQNWDNDNASYCYEDRISYFKKEVGVIDLSEIKNILDDIDVRES